MYAALRAGVEHRLWKAAMCAEFLATKQGVLLRKACFRLVHAPTLAQQVLPHAACCMLTYAAVYTRPPSRNRRCRAVACCMLYADVCCLAHAPTLAQQALPCCRMLHAVC